MNVGSSEILDLIQQGALVTYPLIGLSVLVLTIALERVWRFRGLEAGTRALTGKLVDALARRQVAQARALCEASHTPMAAVFGDGLRWRNIALEDLHQVLATSRQEAVAELRRGIWLIGTVGSLAPYIGLFGTVVGIMRAFRQIAEQGDAGFAVVSEGIAEALIATAVGLLVAIFSLLLFNWLQVRLAGIGAAFTRASERVIQALLYAESGAAESASQPPQAEVGDGRLSPA